MSPIPIPQASTWLPQQREGQGFRGSSWVEDHTSCPIPYPPTATPEIRADLVETYSCSSLRSYLGLPDMPAKKRLYRIPAVCESSLLDLWFPLLWQGAYSLSILSVLLNSSFVRVFQMCASMEELSPLPHLSEMLLLPVKEYGTDN